MMMVLQAALPLIPGLSALGSNVAWLVGILLVVSYYAVPIYLVVIILLYELLVKIDIAGGMNYLAKAVMVLAKKSQLMSLIPSTTTINHDAQAELFKIESPLNLFLNLNRAILYFALFLSLVTLAPFSWVINFPMSIYVPSFNLINNIIAVEPLFLSPLFIFAVIDKFADVASDMSKLVRG